MKSLLLFCCLLATAPAFAQMQPTLPTNAERAAQEIANGKEMAEPFKGATTILIHTTDSAAVALKKFARALLANDMEPDKIDAELGYLRTKDKMVGQLSPAVYQYKVISSAERGGTLLAVTGNFTARVSLTQTISVPMVWVKGNLLQAKQCFALIQAVALAYPGGRIGYVSKPTQPTIQR